MKKGTLCDNDGILKTDAILQVKGCSTHRRSLYLYEYFVDFCYSRMTYYETKIQGEGIFCLLFAFTLFCLNSK